MSKKPASSFIAFSTSTARSSWDTMEDAIPEKNTMKKATNINAIAQYTRYSALWLTSDELEFGSLMLFIVFERSGPKATKPAPLMMANNTNAKKYILLFRVMILLRKYTVVLDVDTGRYGSDNADSAYLLRDRIELPPTLSFIKTLFFVSFMVALLFFTLKGVII